MGAIEVLQLKQALRTQAYKDTAPLTIIFVVEQANKDHNFNAVFLIPEYCASIEKLMQRARTNFREMNESPRVARFTYAYFLNSYLLLKSTFDYKICNANV